MAVAGSTVRNVAALQPSCCQLFRLNAAAADVYAGADALSTAALARSTAADFGMLNP